MINVSLETYVCGRLVLTAREIGQVADQVTSGLGISDPVMDILVCDDRSMEDFNRHFLGMEGPTNVLSFPEGEPEYPDNLGQMIINIDAIERESVLYGQEPYPYLIRLMVHGILHLAGYEHGPEMTRLSDELIMDIVGLTAK